MDFIRTLGWALAGAAGAVAGIFQTVNGIGNFSPDSIEFSLLLVSGFIAAVIGGLDSLLGAVIGGMFLGLTISFILMYVSSGLFFIAPFVILLTVLQRQLTPRTRLLRGSWRGCLDSLRPSLGRPALQKKAAQKATCQITNSRSPFLSTSTMSKSA